MSEDTGLIRNRKRVKTKLIKEMDEAYGLSTSKTPSIRFKILNLMITTKNLFA